MMVYTCPSGTVAFCRLIISKVVTHLTKFSFSNTRLVKTISTQKLMQILNSNWNAPCLYKQILSLHISTRYLSIVYGGVISKYFISLGNAWSKEWNLFCIHRVMPTAFSQDTSTFSFIFSLAAVPQSCLKAHQAAKRSEDWACDTWGIKVSGQPWAQLNFYKNFLGKNRNSSAGKRPVHILCGKETLSNTAGWKHVAQSIQKHTTTFSESMHQFVRISYM